MLHSTKFRSSFLNLYNGSQQHSRGMATLKSIQLRLKSVTNIKKITQSMKMVSAAKYARAERDLRQARPYGESTTSFYENAEVKLSTDVPERLIIAVTSDRGLCGAVHTTIARQIRNELSQGAGNIKLVCIGDKSKAILSRLFGQNILFVANEVGRKPPTFLDASKVAQELAQYDFASGKIVYNRFKSVVSYITSELPLYNKDAVANAAKINLYDSVDDDVLLCYLEFSLASLLYYAMKEGACSEQSSRMSAMDNASKNAGQMIEKLQLTYNRTRQSVITRELIEIISGAAALE